MKIEHVATSKNFLHGRKPKILYFDLEISPMLVWTYSAYEANALNIKMMQQIVSFSWQWEGEKVIHVRVLPDYKGYKPGVTRLDDKALVKELHEVMEEADVLVGHNIKDFDVKHAKARFIYHGLAVSKKWVIEDTLKMARKYFKFPKNNLDFLTEQFGLGKKTDVKHSDVIWKCIEGDMKAWKAMAIYNVQDIKLTRGLYKKLAPWHETHSNLNFFLRKQRTCPVCLSERKGRFVKYRYGKTIKKQFQCRDCGKYWTEGKPDEDYEKVTQSNT